MIHFRILIPSQNMPRLREAFYKHTPKPGNRSRSSGTRLDCIALGCRICTSKNKCYNFVTTSRWSDRDTGTKHIRSVVVRVTERERATILAALRRWLSYPAAREADLTATNRGKHKPLDDGEIQRLCKRFNEMARRRSGTPLHRHSNNGAGEDH